MTEIHKYMIENPMFEPCKPQKRYYHSSSLLSILLSISTYVLIFYVFEVSPSSVFKDTKVLFFISNTLILIITVDYGAFTGNERHDFSGEYTAAAAAAMRRRAYNYTPVPVFTYGENARQQNSGHAEMKNRKDVVEESMVKDIVCVSSPPEKIVSQEKLREDVAKEEYKPVSEKSSAVNEENRKARNHVNRKSYGRTKSDKPRRVKITEDEKAKRKSYRRSESDSSKWMVVSQKRENVEEESDEFSKMSNEELNRRVEDFIQRFNRQIRLQSRVSST